MCSKDSKNDKDFLLNMWKVCIEAANRLETRRDNAVKLFSYIFASLTAAYGYLFFNVKNGFACLFVCLFAAFFCAVFYPLISNFKLLAQKKFEIIDKIEEHFDIKPMREEWELVKKEKDSKKISFSLFSFHQKLSILFLYIPIFIGLVFSFLKIFSVV